MGKQSDDKQDRPKPTTGPTTRKPGGERSENMADPDIHDGAARPPGGPEPSDGVGGWRNPI